MAGGAVKGLRARGGFEVDLTWRESRLTAVCIRSLAGNHCQIRYAGKPIELDTQANHIYRFDGSLVIQK